MNEAPPLAEAEWLARIYSVLLKSSSALEPTGFRAFATALAEGLPHDSVAIAVAEHGATVAHLLVQCAHSPRNAGDAATARTDHPIPCGTLPLAGAHVSTGCQPGVDDTLAVREALGLPPSAGLVIAPITTQSEVALGISAEGLAGVGSDGRAHAWIVLGFRDVAAMRKDAAARVHRVAVVLRGIVPLALDALRAGSEARRFASAAATPPTPKPFASADYAEAVRLAAERRQLLDAIPCVVFRLDASTGATLYTNAAIERLFGIPTSYAMGVPGLAGLLADDAERASLDDTRLAVLDGGQSAWVERRFSHRDGRTLILRTRLYPVYAVIDAGALTPGAVVIEGIAEDVTGETEARKSLVQTDRLASLGMLAAGIAHEINNPAAFISLGVQQLGRMIAQMPDDAEGIAAARARMTDVVTELADGVQRIVQIVGELKLFTRIPESAFSTPVDVNRLLTSAVTLARSELRRRARIEMNLGDLPPLPGDHARLGQVFVNLLINAAHAIPPGDEARNVVSIQTQAHDGYVHIHVQDTGIGIPRENLTRIFDPFFTTKAPGEGTGLGLAISHDLVKRAGGTIEVSSIVGVGTTFTVRLPIREVATRRGTAATSLVPPPGARILIVEDEQYLGVAIARALAAKHQVEIASAARDALVLIERIERSARDGYQAVLCDLQLPGMNGRAFYEIVCARWPDYRQRFVFVTGAGIGGEFEAFVRSTDRPVLEKPFDMAELEEIVAGVIAHAESRGPP